MQQKPFLKKRVSVLDMKHTVADLALLHIFTKKYLEEIPHLRLTLNISHWCNVHVKCHYARIDSSIEFFI